MTKTITRAAALATALLIAAAPAYAAGSGMPWETPLQAVVDSVTGPVARAAAMILSAWSKKGGPRCGPAVNWHRSIAGASTCRTPRP